MAWLLARSKVPNTKPPSRGAPPTGQLLGKWGEAGRENPALPWQAGVPHPHPSMDQSPEKEGTGSSLDILTDVCQSSPTKVMR